MLRMWKLWRSRKKLLALVYLVIGVIVADAHQYFAGIQTFMAGLSAVIGVVLWPLVLFGISLHFH